MRLLLSIFAAMLMVQSASAQALWRNYWTTNRYPQNAFSLTNLQSTNIIGTIPLTNLATNSASANQVLTATSAGSAAWQESGRTITVIDTSSSEVAYVLPSPTAEVAIIKTNAAFNLLLSYGTTTNTIIGDNVLIQCLPVSASQWLVNW